MKRTNIITSRTHPLPVVLATQHRLEPSTTHCTGMQFGCAGSTLGLSLFSTSSLAFSHMKSRGGVGVSWTATSSTQRDTPVSSTDDLSIKPTYLASDLERDFKIEQ